MADEDKLISSNERSCKLITKELILEVLRKDKGSDAILQTFNVKDFTKKGDNYSCFITGIKVDYMIEGKIFSTKYVAKCNPKRLLGQGENITLTQFTNENKFYAVLLPALNEILHVNNQESLRVPKFYHYSDIAGSEVIFFEDMRERGFKLFDKLKGVDELHGELVFRELGRLHAAGKLMIEQYGQEKAISKFKLMDIIWLQSEEMAKPFFNSMMVAGSKLTEKLGPKYQRASQVLLEMGSGLIKILENLLSTKRQFETIQHGDCWNNNLLFRYEDEKPVEVCLLDLQMITYTSVGIDLNYFLYTSFNGPERKTSFDKFFDIYYKAYKDCLPTGITCPFTRQELVAEFEMKKAYGMIMNIMILPLIVCSADEVPNFDDVTEEELPTKIAEMEEERIRTMSSHPIFVPRFKAMLDEMIAAGVLPQS